MISVEPLSDLPSDLPIEVNPPDPRMLHLIGPAITMAFLGCLAGYYGRKLIEESDFPNLIKIGMVAAVLIGALDVAAGVIFGDGSRIAEGGLFISGLAVGYFGLAGAGSA